MKITRLFFCEIMILALILSPGCKVRDEAIESNTGNLRIGWASSDITPDKPVILHGQFHARISEGIMDPVTATALALESSKDGITAQVIMISCDLVFITRDLRDQIRELVTGELPELKPEQITLYGTHTHSAPQFGASREVIDELAPDFAATSCIKNVYGIGLDAMEFSECRDFLAKQISKAAVQAWKGRKQGGVSYGLGHAVVGHNRLKSDFSGKSTMYGRTDVPEFSNMEGYVDHSVNLLYTWNKQGKLTGVVINVPCPAQVSENSYLISADYWHDTRVKVREKLGEEIFILPQISAAGDQSPHLLMEMRAEERMQRLIQGDTVKTGRGTLARRKQIASEITGAVLSVLPYMKNNIEWDPKLIHRMGILEMTRPRLDIKDVEAEFKEALQWKERYEKLLQELNAKPELKEKPRWYVNVTTAHRRMLRGFGVKNRYEQIKTHPKLPVEIHVVRLGDIVFATNEFELYLDYGMRIKGRSCAVQTFLVQHGGHGSYIPAIRSMAGGSYGAIPASIIIGPEGGQELVEATLDMIISLWQEKD